MRPHNTIRFRKLDKYNHINFFEVKKPFSFNNSLFYAYVKWLFKSTLEIKDKKNITKIYKRHSEIIRATEILKSNYDLHLIDRRNSQLLQYILSKGHS